MFDSFILPNNTLKNNDKISPPLVYINLNSSSGLLTISQQNATQTIPINIIDNLSRHTQLIFDTLQISTPHAVKFVIAEPNSYVRHIYNVNF